MMLDIVLLFREVQPSDIQHPFHVDLETNKFIANIFVMSALKCHKKAYVFFLVEEIAHYYSGQIIFVSQNRQLNQT